MSRKLTNMFEVIMDFIADIYPIILFLFVLGIVAAWIFLPLGPAVGITIGILLFMYLLSNIM